MPFFSFINRLIDKIKPALTPLRLAKQLRQPHGKTGIMVAKKMNDSNSFLYDFTIESMDIKDHNAILEIGFGNGKFFEKIFNQAQHLKVSGIDFSETMVDEAERDNEKLLQTGALDLWIGDCEVLPFDNESMDKVFCINVVYFWDNPVDNLMEIHRVLKPGGKFYTCIRHQDSMKYMPFTKHGFNMYDEESWSNQLQRNLFKLDEIKTVNEPMLEFNGERFIPKSLCFIAQKI